MFFARNYLDDEMGRACGTCGEKAYGVQWGGLKERDHMEDLGVNGRVISQWISKKWAVRSWGWILLWVGTIGEYL